MQIRHTAILDITAALASIDKLTQAYTQLQQRTDAGAAFKLTGITEAQGQLSALVAQLKALPTRSSLGGLNGTEGEAKRKNDLRTRINDF